MVMKNFSLSDTSVFAKISTLLDLCVVNKAPLMFLKDLLNALYLKRRADKITQPSSALVLIELVEPGKYECKKKK